MAIQRRLAVPQATFPVGELLLLLGKLLSTLLKFDFFGLKGLAPRLQLASSQSEFPLLLFDFLQQLLVMCLLRVQCEPITLQNITLCT